MLRAVPSHVDYALARRAVLRDLRRGAVTRLDVCDAHPELLRAARNVGEPAPHGCPICGSERVRYVSYVYGDTLKQANGRCITYPGELDKLDASFDERSALLELDPRHVAMVRAARAAGASANYAGSGGAIVGTLPPSGLEPVASALRALGCDVSALSLPR